MTAVSERLIDVQVPDAKTEQLFLLLAVQAAVKTYRARRAGAPALAPPEGAVIPPGPAPIEAESGLLPTRC
jgi:hypothetical protein